MEEERSNMQQATKEVETTEVTKVFNGVRVEYSIDRLRLIASSINGRAGFTSKQIDAFLLIYRHELQSKLDQTVKNFIQSKIGIEQPYK